MLGASETTRCGSPDAAAAGDEREHAEAATEISASAERARRVAARATAASTETRSERVRGDEAATSISVVGHGGVRRLPELDLVQLRALEAAAHALPGPDGDVLGRGDRDDLVDVSVVEDVDDLFLHDVAQDREV